MFPFAEFSRKLRKEVFLSTKILRNNAQHVDVSVMTICSQAEATEYLEPIAEGFEVFVLTKGTGYIAHPL
jgi:hypothetical protein